MKNENQEKTPLFRKVGETLLEILVELVALLLFFAIGAGLLVAIGAGGAVDNLDSDIVALLGAVTVLAIFGVLFAGVAIARKLEKKGDGMNTKKSLSGSSFGILGDSYSTFQGYIPEENLFYYPCPKAVEDVLRVEQTWWHRLMQKRNLRLLVNESYSGATVCEDVLEGYPIDSAFTRRAIRVFGPETEEKPDIIFLFGCTNDSWFGQTPGKLQYKNWSTADLQKTLPAYCYTLANLKENNPNATVVAIINTDLKEEIREGMVRAGEHYGICNVVLSDIHKQNGHPTALGMEQIFHQVDAVLNTL